MTFDGRLQAVFRAVFGAEVSTLSDEDDPSTIRAWDSLNHVHLMLALEAEFDVRFDADEFANLISVGAIRQRLYQPQPSRAPELVLLTPAPDTADGD